MPGWKYVHVLKGLQTFLWSHHRSTTHSAHIGLKVNRSTPQTLKAAVEGGESHCRSASCMLTCSQRTFSGESSLGIQPYTIHQAKGRDMRAHKATHTLQPTHPQDWALVGAYWCPPNHGKYLSGDAQWIPSKFSWWCTTVSVHVPCTQREQLHPNAIMTAL